MFSRKPQQMKTQIQETNNNNNNSQEQQEQSQEISTSIGQEHEDNTNINTNSNNINSINSNNNSNQSQSNKNESQQQTESANCSNNKSEQQQQQQQNEQQTEIVTIEQEDKAKQIENTNETNETLINNTEQDIPITQFNPSNANEDQENPIQDPNQIELSLCGDLIPKLGEDKLAEIFEKQKVSYELFIQDPQKILQNKNLMVKIGDQVYDWEIAVPFIISLLAFKQPLPETVMKTLSKQLYQKKNQFWKQ
eukprot:TRINITY_DN7969_c0_g1_i3.p2 TRINITY_DN7969_c0_g1~~TRINITY_DN7969_c0_g1_i3.p2  ORF type:complete len:251 (-),score=57.12 TRINITY_DN7969_c0_g1_i3:868-1620(-)